MVLDRGKTELPSTRRVAGTVAVVATALVCWYVGDVISTTGVPGVVGVETDLAGIVSRVVHTVATLLVAAAVVRAADDSLILLETESVFTPHQTEVAYRAAQVAAFGGAAALVVVGVWGVSLTNVLLGAGVTSVVVALAARQTLSSVFAGLTLISTDVFRVGDWVKIDSRFGKIEQISLFNTTMESPRGETHVIPNDEVITRDITNLGKGRYRNDVLVGVAYETDIEHATGVCDEVLTELTDDDETNIDGYQPTTVKDFDDSQITLAVKMWVDEPKPMAINRAQTAVLAGIQDRFDEEDITIPFPQRTFVERDATA